MDNFNNQIIEYMTKEKNKLKKNSKLYRWFDDSIRLLLIFLNLAIIAIAIVVIVIESRRYYSTSNSNNSSQSFGLTIVLATFIVLTFFFNMFLSVYKEIMKYKDYKKAVRKLQYIGYKYKEDKTFTKELFDQQYDEIINKYLAKKNKSKTKLIKKFLISKGDK
ncbi:hypothetical protein [[Mycoplasma] collis]|uniref:hypothetical protein n=1 Tax=[Mycoplasma] collis TaxID=2127 RepID=UPI00051C5EB4|nr:hypothetical protein [[Mycoplasma] collis]